MIAYVHIVMRNVVHDISLNVGRIYVFTIAHICMISVAWIVMFTCAYLCAKLYWC